MLGAEREDAAWDHVPQNTPTGRITREADHIGGVAVFEERKDRPGDRRGQRAFGRAFGVSGVFGRAGWRGDFASFFCGGDLGERSQGDLDVIKEVSTVHTFNIL